jgi:Rho-binding antiterminator
MTDKSYEPISCDYHDLLEVHATKRQPTTISFRDADATVKTITATITDVFARAGADYLSTSTGETLRLDQLIEVDGVKLSDY